MYKEDANEKQSIEAKMAMMIILVFTFHSLKDQNGHSHS